MQSFLDLASAWRSEAVVLRRRGDERAATLLCDLADELTNAVAQADDEVLSLNEAATVSGFSTSHLGRLLRQGTIPNAGRANAPAIHRRDVPIKPGHLPLSAVPHHLADGQRERIARSIVNSK